jgi:hypothetical protein
MRRTAPLVLLVTAVHVLAPAPSSAQLNLTGATVRLYEQDGGFVLDESRRMYTTRFDALATRYIGVEIALTHAAATAGAAGRVAVSCDEVTPDGRTITGMFKIPVDVQAGQTRSTGANTLFGGGRDGRWLEGSYRVRCSWGSRALGETAFQMTVNPSDVAGADVHATAIRFFPTGAQLTGLADRTYSDRFSPEETTRIGVELSFAHPALGKALEVPVDCYYLMPNGRTMGPMSFPYKPAPDSTRGQAAMGIGWDQPKQWPGGNYTAVCRINGRPVAVARFAVY